MGKNCDLLSSLMINQPELGRSAVDACQFPYLRLEYSKHVLDSTPMLQPSHGQLTSYPMGGKLEQGANSQGGQYAIRQG
jgi:hypothetical protein